MPLYKRLRIQIVARLCILPLILVYAANAQAATLGELYVMSVDPLFAEIPVCNPGPDGPGYSATIITDELIEKDGSQPFADTTEITFDSYSDLEGLVSISGERAAPQGISIVVTLLDENGQISDSQQYIDLTTVRPSPDDFGCTAPVVEQPQQQSVDFMIDTVTGDNWRNIATMVNIAWYSQQYPVEQVMLALYKYNTNETLNLSPGVMYSLPDQLRIPDQQYPQTITADQLSLAANLDFIGRLKVEKRRNRDSAELKQLREKFNRLQQQIEELRHVLADTQQLNQLKDQEVARLRQNLVDTRQRISVLEKQNEELSSRSLLQMINESILTNPLAWILVFLLVFSLFMWLVFRGINQDRKRDIEILRGRVNQKKK